MRLHQGSASLLATHRAGKGLLTDGLSRPRAPRRFMTVGLVRGRVSVRSCLYVLVGSLVWNVAGCVFFAFLFGWVTDVFSAEPWLSWLRAAGASKARMAGHVAFFRAIPANIMICTAIHMGISARDMLGKLVALHFPLTVYTVAGFEHGVGNLILVPLAAMYGADLSLSDWIAYNLVPDFLGNLVGGALVGLADVALFSWDGGMFNTNQLHNHAHDAQSIRRHMAAAAAAAAAERQSQSQLRWRGRCF